MPDISRTVFFLLPLLCFLNAALEPGEHVDCIFEREGVFLCDGKRWQPTPDPDEWNTLKFWGDIATTATLILAAGI